MWILELVTIDFFRLLSGLQWCPLGTGLPSANLQFISGNGSEGPLVSSLGERQRRSPYKSPRIVLKHKRFEVEPCGFARGKNGM